MASAQISAAASIAPACVDHTSSSRRVAAPNHCPNCLDNTAQRTVSPVKASTHRYRDIEQFLRRRIDAAEPGDVLPTEAELCARFGVSRMTVRQAVQELTN